MTGPLPFDPVAEAARHWREHGWEDAAPGMAAVTALMRAQQIMQARVDAELRPLGMTFARYEVLMLLLFSASGRLPMRVIGDRLQVHPTSVTNAVDRLEAASMVRRTPHPDDRRAVLVELTEPGREVAHEATRRLNARVFTEVGVSEDHLRALTAALEELRTRAGDFA
ncbi:MAG: MarR family transcriptional regulator [Candidatus Nanopelagicales bacterium]